jgi:hypothetical protein
MTRTRLLLLVALLALVAVPVVVLLRVGDPADSAADPAPDPTALADRQPATDPAADAAATDPAADADAAAAGDGATAAALRVLHAWDARRADAWAAGAPARLRALYVSGSAAGEADVRLLRRYRARGLRVTRMRTQVLALHVLEERPHRRRVEVSDRLAGAVVVGAGRRTTLPRDAASTWVVTLVQAPGGRWRVAAVTARE